MLGSQAREIRILPIPGIAEIQAGDSLGQLIARAAGDRGIEISNADVLVVTQKVISKAEGRLVRLRDVKPSPLARAWARQMKRDARHLEVILQESKRIIRMTETVIISETHHDLKCANAGVDHSNIPGEGVVSVLPLDPDESARRLRAEIEREAGAQVAVIITDTFGRPWREGLTNVAIGVAGLKPLKDYRGTCDAVGKPLTATIIAVADELAAAAGLAMGKADRVPAVLIKGYAFERGEGNARDLIRPKEQDLFP